MRLERLLDDVHVLERRGDTESVDVASVTSDSRLVGPGALFCCVPGRTSDGHDHAVRAVAEGAVGLLCERLLPVEVAQVRVASTRRAMAPVAAALHGHPSRSMAVVGVTGTNGKTTVTHLLAAALRANGWTTGVIGTLDGPRTTPEAPELQAALARHLAGGAVAVALEVSSDALVQHRADAVWFEVAAFTNLSPEHLNTHGDMESYFAAKASLFDPARAATAVVNADDPWGRRLLEAARLPTVPYTLSDAADMVVMPRSTTFRWEDQPVHLRLGGRHNVSNAVCAATIARVLGVPAERVAAGLSALGHVPGRFERVDAGQAFGVVVDYAHTPAALEQVLLAARDETGGGGGRVIVVFGCGGERDRTKRPLMGEVAARLADVVVLTSDNPRGEDPQAIIDEVRAGTGAARRLVVEPDRHTAVHVAVAEAGPGDVVVVAGKGHETGQTVGGRTEPFDDREVALQALARAGHGTGAAG